MARLFDRPAAERQRLVCRSCRRIRLAAERADEHDHEQDGRTHRGSTFELRATACCATIRAGPTGRQRSLQLRIPRLVRGSRITRPRKRPHRQDHRNPAETLRELGPGFSFVGLVDEVLHRDHNETIGILICGSKTTGASGTSSAAPLHRWPSPPTPTTSSPHPNQRKSPRRSTGMG